MSDEVDKLVEEATSLTFGQLRAQIRYAQPGFREAQAQRNRDLPNRPEWLKKTRENAQKRANDPEWALQQSRRIKQKYDTDPEYRQRRLESNRRLAKDPEWLKKNKDRLQKMHSDPAWQEKRRLLAKPVVCIETGAIFLGAAYAAKDTGGRATTITSVCRGKRRTAGGYHWRYATPEEAEAFKASQSEPSP